MQVTNTSAAPPIDTATVSPASARADQTARTERSAPAKEDGLTVRSFERALVEAAGLSPDQASRVRVALSVDGSSNRVIAKMYNKETGELILQVPTDQMLRNSALIREFLGAAYDAFA